MVTGDPKFYLTLHVCLRFYKKVSVAASIDIIIIASWGLIGSRLNYSVQWNLEAWILSLLTCWNGSSREPHRSVPACSLGQSWLFYRIFRPLLSLSWGFLFTLTFYPITTLLSSPSLLRQLFLNFMITWGILWRCRLSGEVPGHPHLNKVPASAVIADLWSTLWIAKF